jgi:hypothetical protein
MPYKKNAPDAQKKRVFVPLRVLGNLFLLVGIVLMSATAIIPGFQIIGIPIIMTAGLGLLGTYIGANFLYGITNIVIKFAKHSLPEKKALFEFWIEREKPSWFRKNVGRLRYVYFAAFSEAVSDLLSETQKALRELAFGTQHLQALSKVSDKLSRLNGLISDIKNVVSDVKNFILDVISILPLPTIKSDNFSAAKELFYQKVKEKLKHQTFSQALEAKIIEKAEENNSALSQDEIKAERTELLNSIIKHAASEENLRKNNVKNREITLEIENEGKKRKIIAFKTLGSILLTIGVTAALAASVAFPILPTAIVINILLAGVIMVSTYVITNFGVDTTKSLLKITKQYVNEKEPLFNLFCQLHNIEPSISWSYFNTRMQIIYFPAMSAACADLIKNLKNALSESVKEFLALPGMGTTARLTNLFHQAQNGWVKTFGVSSKLKEFQETEKTVLALLANMRYGSFEAGVLDLENSAEIQDFLDPKKRKEKALEKLTDILKNEVNRFNAQEISPENKEIQLKNMHRRFHGYQRAVRNETLRLLNLPENKENFAYTQAMAKTEAIKKINEKHPISSYHNFPEELNAIIDLDKTPDNEIDDRLWVPLRVLGNLGLATGIILGLLSFAIPGLPILVVPALMGISATMLITYIAKNFQYNLLRIINKERKIYQEERIPYFEIWAQTKDLPTNGIRGFFLRLLCTTIPAIQAATADMNQELDSSISEIIKEGRYISEKNISEKTKKLHTDLRSLNRFEQLIDRVAVDLVPLDFRETEELIDIFLMSLGYDSFEKGIKGYQEIHGLDREPAKTKLTNILKQEVQNFNENLKKHLNEKNNNPVEVKKKLLTPYYEQYQKHKNDAESKKRHEKIQKIQLELNEKFEKENEELKQERDEKSENDSPPPSPRQRNN